MDEKIKVRIVAPVHNRRSITLQCLKSLQRLNSAGLEINIIIVDDGSTDGTSEAISEKFPAVELVKGDGNLWFTEATNVGIRSALKHSPDYVLTINDDAVFDADFLIRMVAAAEKYPHSVIGSLLLLWNAPHKIFQVAPVFEVTSGGWRHWHQQTIWTVPDKVFEVDLIVGNCVLFPAKVFAGDNLMNSRRYPNFGDAEFTPRLKKQGWKLLIEPRARVFCQPNTLPAKITKMTFKQKFDALFVNLGHIHNLRRRFYADWDGAPSRISGVAAFFVFLARIFVRRNVENEEHSMFCREKPLAEILAGSVLDD